MQTITPAKIELDNGKSYFLELGTVRSTFLGREDHGIFTFNLDFDFNGSGQGFGNIFLADTLPVLVSLIDFAGSWESIVGKQFWVMREKEYDTIKGLMSVDQRNVWILTDEIQKVLNEV